MRRVFGAVAVLSVASAVMSSPCNATYYLQGGTQYLFTTSVAASRTVLSSTSQQVWSDMYGVQIVDTGMEYSVLSEFTPTCGAWVTGPAEELVRRSGSASTFAAQPRSDLFYRIIGNLNVTGCGEFYTAFAFKTDSLSGTPFTLLVGRIDSLSPNRIWYGACAVRDSTYSSGTGEWSPSDGFFTPQNYTHCDSAALRSGMEDVILGSRPYGANHHGYMVTQLLKLEFDTIPPAAVADRPPRSRTQPLTVRGVRDMSQVSVFDPRGRLVRQPAYLAGRAPGVYLVRIQDSEQLLRARVIRAE